MSGFQEHFLDKYFAYRRRYVADVAARAPRRRSWAVASEIARLGFVIFGCALCALILWALTFDAFGRARGNGLLPFVFLVLALLPSVFAALSLRALCVAIGERTPLKERPADAANEPRR